MMDDCNVFFFEQIFVCVVEFVWCEVEMFDCCDYCVWFDLWDWFGYYVVLIDFDMIDFVVMLNYVFDDQDMCEKCVQWMVFGYLVLVIDVVCMVCIVLCFMLESGSVDIVELKLVQVVVVYKCGVVMLFVVDVMYKLYVDGDGEMWIVEKVVCLIDLIEVLSVIGFLL